MTLAPLLSICIPTLNRAKYIGETLDRIVDQVMEDVEIVIVDGGSSDDTAEILELYTQRFAWIHVHGSDVSSDMPSNQGFDRDCDKSVRMANGQYCWLFTDDDWIKPGAITKVIADLRAHDPDLLVVDAEIYDITMTKQLDAHRLPFTTSRNYDAGDHDRLLGDIGRALSFVGMVIIRRRCWLDRQREPYFGTGFVHVCVIFQQAFTRARVLAEPLVRIRMGNALWSGRAFDIWHVQWPKVVWAFDNVAADTRHAITPREPWHQLSQLVLSRAKGSYGITQYRAVVRQGDRGARRIVSWLLARMPGRFVHVGVVTLLAARGLARSSGVYDLNVSSRYSNPISRGIAWLAGNR